jgi:hypothetical protein
MGTDLSMTNKMCSYKDIHHFLCVFDNVKNCLPNSTPVRNGGEKIIHAGTRILRQHRLLSSLDFLFNCRKLFQTAGIPAETNECDTVSATSVPDAKIKYMNLHLTIFSPTAVS